jgi:hypothetical protein
VPGCSAYPVGGRGFVSELQRLLKMLSCLWQREQVAVQRSKRTVSSGYPLAVIDLLGDAQSLPGTF